MRRYGAHLYTNPANTAMRLTADLSEVTKRNYYDLLAFITQSFWDVVLKMDNELVGQIIKDQILLICSDGDYKPKAKSTNMQEQVIIDGVIEDTKQYMLFYKTAKRSRYARVKKELTVAHAPELDMLTKESKISTKYKRRRDAIDEVVKNAKKAPKIVFVENTDSTNCKNSQKTDKTVPRIVLQ